MLELPRQQMAIDEVTDRSDKGSSRLRATDWWMEGELRRLNADLAKTREELETLRTTTARMVTAILASLQGQPGPVAEVAPEIQGLADLSEPAGSGSSDDPITEEVEVLDLANRDSLAYLDRRFRWVRPRRQEA